MPDMEQKQGIDIMSWTPYLVSFKLVSPAHIGWKKVGNLQVTRPYVTGKTLWGALTARLVRDEKKNNYSDIGKKVDNELRFTYFYPSTTQDKVSLWPWNKKNDFAWRFLSSYVSTAIASDTAEEGSLHEVEYISPTTRDGSLVFLIGYVFEKNGCQLKWKDALTRIQLGGERGYGWGRTELVSDPNKVERCFDCDIDISNSSPRIIVLKQKAILAHTQTDGLECKEGCIEPLVGRETNDKDGFGGNVSQANICYAPGCRVVDDTTFTIQPRGLWRKERGNSSGGSNP